jgi:hypothetical protein
VKHYRNQGFGFLAAPLTLLRQELAVPIVPNPEDRLAFQVAWAKANSAVLERVSKARGYVDSLATARRAKKRMLRDPAFKLSVSVRGRIRSMLRAVKCRDSSKRLLGCSAEQLRLHLESRFLPGMTWANYGQWHVDHVRPCASFDLTNEAERSACFHYSNLQPLWARDNLRKSSQWKGKHYVKSASIA